MDKYQGHTTSNPAMEPEQRIKYLTQLGDSIEIDATIPARRFFFKFGFRLVFNVGVIIRYFRSGLEMVRMANCYCEEGNLESAFIIYMKFIV